MVQVGAAYGKDEIILLQARYQSREEVGTQGEALTEWGVFKALLAQRPRAEPFQETYTFFKVTTVALSMSTIHFLLDVKNVLIFSTPEAERGFNIMKLAKPSISSSMNGEVLDNRMMIALNAPEDAHGKDFVEMKVSPVLV